MTTMKEKPMLQILVNRDGTFELIFSVFAPEREPIERLTEAIKPAMVIIDKAIGEFEGTLICGETEGMLIYDWRGKNV